MKNFVRPGKSVPVTAPALGVASGQAFAIDTLVGFAGFTAAQGEPVEMHIEGVFRVPGLGATVGAPVYFDAAAGAFALTDVGNIKCGVAVAPNEVRLTPGLG